MLIVLILLVFLVLWLILRSSVTLTTGSAFPIGSVTLTNKLATPLLNLAINDSMGNQYSINPSFVWAAKSAIRLSIPDLPANGSIQVYASTGTDDLYLYLINNNGKIIIEPLLGSDPSCISVSTGSSETMIDYETVYENTEYAVKGAKLIQSGQPFPKRFVCYNNTFSTVLAHSDNQTGTQPQLDQMTFTNFYVADSEGHTFADVDPNENVSFPPNNKSGKARLTSQTRPIVVDLDQPITDGQSVQFYLETATDSYNIVLYNSGGKVIVVYPADLDPSAVVISSVQNNVHEPCKTLYPRTVKLGSTVDELKAVFDTTSIWTRQELNPSLTPNSMGTLKVGFIGGTPWKWAWIAKTITNTIALCANIDFDFQMNVPVDSTFHIRVAFDPLQGCYSMVGNTSKNGLASISMNMGWMDAPLNTTFYYNQVAYMTDVMFDQGGYPGQGTTIVHEFCHALGMLHEHQNPYGLPWNWNREAVYKYFGGPPNNWSKEMVDTQILALLNTNTTNGSTFDFSSIMRYTFPTALLADATSYQSLAAPNLVLSECDQYWLSQNYPGRNVGLGNAPPVCNATPSNPMPIPLIISNQASVNCVVSDWSPWSTCSATCGGGMQTQTRTITTPAVGTGTVCPILSQTRPCQTQPCSVSLDTLLIPYRTISRRQQWLANYGYCGETSFITSAMYYGMYMSQYDVRQFTSINNTQNKENDQVLIGTQSEVRAAGLFQLNYDRWVNVPTSPSIPVRDTSGFLTWMGSHTALLHPVISVVFENRYLVSIPGGQAEYDHIVSMIDVSGTSITFCDNGIVDPYPNRDSTFNKSNLSMIFTYDLPTFIRNRSDALASASEYSLPSVYPTYQNSGIAITGVKSSEPNLVRIQLTTTDGENALMIDKSNVRPASNAMTITVHMYQLQPNTSYNLYRYKDYTLLPTQQFNAKYTTYMATNPVSPMITIDTFTTTATPPDDFVIVKIIQSNEQALFRCVPASAN